jgi:excisionase family DNA binding protein
MPKFLTADEVAETLHVCRATVLRWCRNGDLKSYQPGQKILISEADFLKFVETSRLTREEPANI